MKLTSPITILCSCTVLAQALSLPEALPRSLPDAFPGSELQETSLEERSETTSSVLSTLWKRRGGGGKGGGGSSSSSSGSSSGGSSSSSGSSGSSSGGSRSGSSGGGRTSLTSNTGGATRSGSGPLPRFGGGKFYGGGAARPYRSGQRSPAGLTPFLLPITALAFFPGLWLYSVYAYPYSRPYYYRNSSRLRDDDDDDDLNDRRLAIRQAPAENGTVQPLPVLCLCQQYSVCGCDDNSDSEFLNSLLPNGTASPQLNETLVRISDVNGTRTLVINATLPNGTTAPGGEDEEGEITAGSTTSKAARTVLESAGWWVLVAIVSGTVWFM